MGTICVLHAALPGMDRSLAVESCSIMNFFILLSLYYSEVVIGYVVDGVYIISNAL